MMKKVNIVVEPFNHQFAIARESENAYGRIIRVIHKDGAFKMVRSMKTRERVGDIKFSLAEV
jgi:hypothetical protein